MAKISVKSSLKTYQRWNGRIYSVTNDVNFSPQDILSRFHRHITQILKAVRKEGHDETLYHLCMALSWSFALANRLHIDLTNELWSFYPGFCPYCISAPCACKTRRKNRRKIAGKSNGLRPFSLKRWQQMFAGIYINKVLNSAIHLAEEAGEVDEALRNHLATHNPKWLRKTTEELVDAVTNIFGVANCLKLDLANGMYRYFGNGCPKCRKLPCNCGWIAIDDPF